MAKTKVKNIVFIKQNIFVTNIYLTKRGNMKKKSHEYWWLNISQEILLNWQESFSNKTNQNVYNSARFWSV